MNGCLLKEFNRPLQWLSIVPLSNSCKFKLESFTGRLGLCQSVCTGCLFAAYQDIFVPRNHFISTSKYKIRTIISGNGIGILAAIECIFPLSARNRVISSVPIDGVLAFIALDIILKLASTTEPAKTFKKRKKKNICQRTASSRQEEQNRYSRVLRRQKWYHFHPHREWYLRIQRNTKRACKGTATIFHLLAHRCLCILPFPGPPKSKSDELPPRIVSLPPPPRIVSCHVNNKRARERIGTPHFPLPWRSALHKQRERKGCLTEPPLPMSMSLPSNP